MPVSVGGGEVLLPARGGALTARAASDAALDLLSQATGSLVGRASSSCACGVPRRESPSAVDALRPSHFDELGKTVVCRNKRIEVPTCVEEITADWLTRVLRHKGILPPHCRVSEVDARPVGGNGQGMMAEMALLNLTFEADATPTAPSPTRAVSDSVAADVPKVEPAEDMRGSPNILDLAAHDGGESAAGAGAEESISSPKMLASSKSTPHLSSERAAELFSVPRQMVAKLSPLSSSVLPGWVVRQQFRQEAHFYNDFTVESGGLPRPKCYVALDGRNLSGRQSGVCMLLEYVGHASMYTRLRSCCERELERPAAVVSALAAFHARWWGHAKASPLESYAHPKHFDGLGRLFTSELLFASLLRTGLPALEQWAGEVYAPVLGWRSLLQRKMPELLAQFFSPPFTLCHGDVHLENIFFSDLWRGGCAFVDFGNMHFDQGVTDVNFFLTTNLPPAYRREHEESLVRAYHRGLLAGGVDEASYPWAQCWRDYRFRTLHVFWFYACGVAPAFARQKRLETGAYAPGGDDRLRQMYEGDGAAGSGFHERIVAALLDHRVHELVQGIGEEKKKSYSRACAFPGFG